jgi:hypothetical protein
LKSNVLFYIYYFFVLNLRGKVTLLLFRNIFQNKFFSVVVESLLFFVSSCFLVIVSFILVDREIFDDDKGEDIGDIDGDIGGIVVVVAVVAVVVFDWDKEKDGAKCEYGYFFTVILFGNVTVS